MKKERVKGAIEIFLLVSSIFAFAYIISELESKEIIIEKKIDFLNILKKIILLVLSEKNLASAQEVEDYVMTCVKAKDNSRALLAGAQAAILVLFLVLVPSYTQRDAWKNLVLKSFLKKM